MKTVGAILLLMVAVQSWAQSVTSITITQGHYAFEGYSPEDKSFLTITANYNTSTHWSAYEYEVKAKYYDSANSLLKSNDWTVVSGSGGGFIDGTVEVSDWLVGPDQPPANRTYVLYQYRLVAKIYLDSTVAASSNFVQLNLSKLWSNGYKEVANIPSGW
ncbi:MAG TPA: hypothetical protein VJ835_08515 [Fimbriimonadaceae bacterium]|nr:hypothetical protein [Fimbriimonadaceae bacterium]